MNRIIAAKARGCSEGTWDLCEDCQIDIEVLVVNNHIVNLVVLKHGIVECVLFAVCASPNVST